MNGESLTSRGAVPGHGVDTAGESTGDPGEQAGGTRPGSVAAWVLAVRPRTLGASVVPVCVGLAVAARAQVLDVPVACVTLLCAMLLQITANLANDYHDFARGVDDDTRLGPLRVTQAGLLSPRVVRTATWTTLLVALACGAYLITIGGVPILAIGMLAAAGALAYSTGPRPLSWYGLGDAMAFVFFGPVAVVGTVILQGGGINAVTLLASVPVGCLVTALIVVNNLRDIDSDTRAGKRTLAVRIGAAATRREYALLVVGAYATVPLLMVFVGTGALTPLLSAPLGLHELRAIGNRGGGQLNQSLVGTARLHVVFGGLLAAGLCL